MSEVIPNNGIDSWENEIAQVAKSYLEGAAEITRRRALWPAAVKDVLLPTLMYSFRL
jgi:hypothetical protein